jgi:hypothetical protein
LTNHIENNEYESFTIPTGEDYLNENKLGSNQGNDTKCCNIIESAHMKNLAPSDSIVDEEMKSQYKKTKDDFHKRSQIRPFASRKDVINKTVLRMLKDFYIR